MSLKITVTAPDDPQVEAILCLVNSFGLPPFEARYALQRAEKWIELATDTTYPAVCGLPSPELHVSGIRILGDAPPDIPVQSQPAKAATPSQSTKSS